MESESIRIVSLKLPGWVPRGKWRRAMELEPDVLLVPVCESLDLLEVPMLFEPFPMEQSLRFASGTSSKGLGVFATSDGGSRSMTPT